MPAFHHQGHQGPPSNLPIHPGYHFSRHRPRLAHRYERFLSFWSSFSRAATYLAKLRLASAARAAAGAGAAAAGAVALAAPGWTIWTGTTPPKGPALASFMHRTRHTLSWPATVPVQAWLAGTAAVRACSDVWVSRLREFSPGGMSVTLMSVHV